MSQARTLVLLRHAAARENRQGLFIGSSNLPVDPDTLSHVDKTSPVLKNYAIKKLFCSPLLRARQTLERLRLTLPDLPGAIMDSDLAEIDFGAWEQQSFAAIASMAPHQVAAWQHDYLSFVFPQGEAVADFLGRVSCFAGRVRALPEGATCLAITHGGVIRTLLCLALGLEPRDYLRFDAMPARLAVLDLYEEGGVLRGFNL